MQSASDLLVVCLTILIVKTFFTNVWLGAWWVIENYKHSSSGAIIGFKDSTPLLSEAKESCGVITSCLKFVHLASQ